MFNCTLGQLGQDYNLILLLFTLFWSFIPLRISESLGCSQIRSGLELILFPALQWTAQWFWTRMSPRLSVPPASSSAPLLSPRSKSSLSKFILHSLSSGYNWSQKGISQREEGLTKVGLFHSAFRPCPVKFIELSSSMSQHPLQGRFSLLYICKLTSVLY